LLQQGPSLVLLLARCHAVMLMLMMTNADIIKGILLDGKAQTTN
jgi:hypothetical protein